MKTTRESWREVTMDGYGQNALFKCIEIQLFLKFYENFKASKFTAKI